tara:strand:+ start:8026 stop:8193 length:168 start_codon:yes stop_codon:yes gene_type:complete
MFEYHKFLKDENGLTAVEFACLISIPAMGLYVPLAMAFNKVHTAADVLVSALAVT